MSYCLVRRREFSPEDFYRYWHGVHAPLVALHAKALRILRYRQVRTLRDPALTRLMAGRNAALPYDGIAELWFDSREELLRNSSNEAARNAARLLYEDEKRFIDLERSPIFFGDEFDVVGQ